MQTEIIYISENFGNYHKTNLNIQHLAYWLEDLGMSTPIRTYINENWISLTEVLDSTIKRSFLTIVIKEPTETKNNKIRRIIAKIFKRKLVLNDKLLTNIKKDYNSYSSDISSSIETNALLPQRSTIIEDETGALAGFFIEEDSKFVIFLSCSFSKIKNILKQNTVSPFFYKTNQALKKENIFYVRTCGLRFDEIKKLIQPIFNDSRLNYSLASNDHGVDIRITTPINEQLSTFKELLINKLGFSIYSFDIIETIEKAISKLFQNIDMDISVAESCTGGLIGHRLTQITGSSKYFKYGVVVYSNIAKQKILGISPVKLEKYGAVSAEIAEEMAVAVKKIAGTKIGLSVTGIAGPEGGSVYKPVGLVFCGLSTNIKTISQSFYFSGDRDSIKFQASQMALDILRKFLITRMG